MNTTKSRSFNCKNEELPAICRYAHSNLKRDLTDFSNYSPVFNGEYADGFEKKINLVDALVIPKTETDELKKITKRLYQTMDGLTDPVLKLRGYLRLAKDTVGMTATDFGLTLLQRKINARDAEGVLQNLRVVNTYINRYRDPLTAVGLSDAPITRFAAAVASITEDNQKQFDITNKRKAIVQNNLEVLNDLNKQLVEILNTGKSLYRNTDALKLQEYTFSRLLKSVRIVQKDKAKEANAAKK